jgi:hypothetical protein
LQKGHLAFEHLKESHSKKYFIFFMNFLNFTQPLRKEKSESFFCQWRKQRNWTKQLKMFW